MFQAEADSLDELMHAVFGRLLSDHPENSNVISSKGDSTEIFGALLHLKNPRARLSRSQTRGKVYSALGELTWYLAASNSIDFIEYYLPKYAQISDDEVTAHGAYGPRIFNQCTADSVGSGGLTQWQRVIKTLRERNGSRNGVIQIYANSDAASGTKDIPCTCTLHFAIRKDKLHLHTHMRSNDALWGFPHDIFSFTMLQEIAARELGKDLGTYHHSVASLHLYNDSNDRESRKLAQAYLAEGLHDFVPMPSMPEGDPWPAIRQLISAEAAVRGGNIGYEPDTKLAPYWTDLITLLKVYRIAVESSTGSPGAMADLIASLNSRTYESYILDRVEKNLGPAQRIFDFFKKRVQ